MIKNRGYSIPGKLYLPSCVSQICHIDFSEFDLTLCFCLNSVLVCLCSNTQVFAALIHIHRGCKKYPLIKKIKLIYKSIERPR